jgi:glutathione S-transferase
MSLRLYTIPISHYCEKARWALDRSGLPYRESRHLQIFHYAAVGLAGGGTTVPVLAVGGRRSLCDSTEILRWIDEQAPGSLYPRDEPGRAEIMRLEDRFDEDLGPATRRVAYFHFLPEKRLLHYNGIGAPLLERAAIRAGFAFAGAFIRLRLRITPEAVARDEVAIRALFDEVARTLAGRRYLVGDRFTAADLTFASMAAPVLAPAEYGTPLPRLDELPPPLRDLVEELRRHPAGAYALRLFREDRHAGVRGEEKRP